MDDLVYDHERVVNGNKVYTSKDRQPSYEAASIEWRVNRETFRGQKLTSANQAFNRKSSRTRT